MTEVKELVDSHRERAETKTESWSTSVEVCFEFLVEEIPECIMTTRSCVALVQHLVSEQRKLIPVVLCNLFEGLCR